LAYELISNFSANNVDAGDAIEDNGLTAYRGYWQFYSSGELSKVVKTHRSILEWLISELKINEGPNQTIFSPTKNTMAATTIKKNVTGKTVSIKKTRAVKGLQTAIITDLIDPQGEFRVKVILPGTTNNNESIFARLASFDAGNNRGAFYMPEIGDEVVVGFINDDAGQPIVMGSLYSSKNKPPLVAEDANHQKGYVSRSKIKILIDDDKKIFTIETPAGNSITLDEDKMKIEIVDQQQNKITMQSSGIILESSHNIDIRAGGVVNLSAGAALSIGASSVSIKATADLQLEGAITKFAAQGINEISGSVVKIN
jgi:uncharacterized protein involved in type VI secretion and phage assembly